MIKHILAVAILLAACATTPPSPPTCQARVAEFGKAQLAAGHEFVGQQLLGPTVFAAVFADSARFYVLGVVSPGGTPPPAAMGFAHEGQCALKDTIIAETYTGTVPIKPAQQALALPQ